MKTLFIALRSLVYLSCFVLLWSWVALWIQKYDPIVGVLLPPWVEIPGMILIMIGGSLAILCIGTFVVSGKGTAAPFDAPREFVAAGPYRFVRNPMYIGGWLVLAGFGMYEHSLSIVLFSMLWLILANLFVFFVEEPGLERRFGQSYLDYKKSVRRWLPKPNSSR